jgi:octaprenyl-diphosphate synthase
MSATAQLTSLYEHIGPELEQVRGDVRRHWTEAFRLVYGPSATPPRVGGKMLRPALCLLSAGASGAQDLSHFVDMATAMELLHLAALAHDDVVDSAHLRRGESSLNTLWDNHTAVLGGDYLVARALTVLTVYDSCPVVACALESIHEMAEGELIHFGRPKDRLEEDDCLRLAQKKTASLFAAACKAPALLLDGAYRDALHQFGMGLGTAFQLIDDVLDLEQDEATLGKPACGDIVEGKATLPILYLREAMDTAERARLVAMTGVTLTPSDREWIAAMLKSTGAQDRTESLARKYVDQAIGALEALPRSVYAEAMAGIAEFVLIRNS